jgi:hypothetical protein
MKMKQNGEKRLCEHNYDLRNLTVLKVVTCQKKLDAYKSIYIESTLDSFSLIDLALSWVSY